MTDEESKDPQDDEPQLNRRERRARAKQDKGEGESVQDRNARLRSDAASKRRQARAAEREQAAALGLGAQERVDDALARSAQVTGSFVRQNFAWLQWIIVLGVGAAIAILVLRYREKSARQKQGHVVASVLANELGEVVTEEPTEARDPRLVDPRKEFESEEKQSEAALTAWGRLTDAKSPELQILGALGRANNLSDLGKTDAARAAFAKVLEHPQAKLHPMLSGRAHEGVGMSFEAEEKWDEARQAYTKMKELQGQQQLATFHIARVDFLSGKVDEAKKALTELDKKLSKDSPDDMPSDYLGAAVRDLLRTVDPYFAIAERQRLEQKQQMEQAKRFQEMIEEMQRKNGGNLDLPGMPGPGDAPEAPAPGAPESPAPSEPAPETP